MFFGRERKKAARKLCKVLVLLMALCLILVTTAPVTAIDQVLVSQSHTLITGVLDDGTPWAVARPTEWNGTIILNLDGNAVRTTINETVEWLLAHGYAYGGTTRMVVGYDLVKAVDNLVEVRQEFISYYGQTPTRTIAWGFSRGSNVARLAMELYPGIFDAALVYAGGGPGMVALFNSQLDGRFIIKTLVDPDSPARLVGIPNTAQERNIETAAINNLFSLAESTPEGRARLALAAGIQQVPAWTVSGTEHPAPNDYDAQYEQIIVPLKAASISIRAMIEEIAGGNISWNNDVNYTEMLARSGRQDFVVAMYEKAGLGRKGLMEDLRLLDQAPRISADPEAVAMAEKFLSYTGQIYGPIINVDNIGDQIDYPPMKTAYEETIRRAGNNKLFELVWVKSTGHGNISHLELITAFVTLINRLDTGKWGDTSARGMNRLAAELLSETDLLSKSDPRFIEYKTNKMLRTWDVRNWDSYQP